MFPSNSSVTIADDLFTDMIMSSSMYEVFNWNTSHDPLLSPAKNKRASLSLPPTTGIFAFDDNSHCNARSPMIHQGTSGKFRNQKEACIGENATQNNLLVFVYIEYHSVIQIIEYCFIINSLLLACLIFLLFNVSYQ